MNDINNELLITRLSHDLAGSIGAVANAVELLEEDSSGFIESITSILKTSSSSLAARLKFFRMTFGVRNANLENIDTVIKTAEDYINSQTNKNFPVCLTYSVSNIDNRKTSLIMIMLLTDIIIRGGKIVVWDEENKIFAKAETDNKFADEKIIKIENIINKNINSDEPENVHALILKNKKTNIIRNDNVIMLTVE